MKKIILISILLVLATIAPKAAPAMPTTAPPVGFWAKCVVTAGDTVPLFSLPTVYVFPPMKFRSKREERFYWRTVRDVKKVLPYSKMIAGLIREVNDTLMRLPTDRARDKYMREWEKTTYKKYYKEFTQMTLSQGKLLIRLVERECQISSYELIRAYRGRFTAGFYQMFAKMFGADLKASFGSGRDDKIIERIIVLVEAGQL